MALAGKVKEEARGYLEDEAPPGLLAVPVEDRHTQGEDEEGQHRHAEGHGEGHASSLLLGKVGHSVQDCKYTCRHWSF